MFTPPDCLCARPAGRTRAGAVEPSRPLGSNGACPRSRYRAAGYAALLILAVLPTALFGLDPAKSLFQYNIRNWSRYDGLPGDKIETITQSIDGYMWFGTQNGLVRFDGIEFSTHPIDLPTAGGQDIKRVAAAQGGGVWFAVIGGGFGHYDGRRFLPAEENPPAPLDVDARALLVTRDGTAWFGGSRELGFRRPGAPFRRVDSVVPRVTCFAEDRAGRIWIGTEETGLYYWKDGRLHPAPDESLKPQLIHALAGDHEGNLWVATQLGLRCYSPDGSLLTSEVPEHRVTSLLVDRHNQLWVGTTAGLARRSRGEYSFLLKSDGLGSEYITSIYEDAEGSIWAGRVDGLSQLTDVKFPIFSSKDGLPYASAEARTPAGGLTVSPSRRGGIWVTLTHGLAHFDGRQFTTMLGADQLKNVYIKLGFEARNGDFYFVDGDKAISVLSGGQITQRIQAPDWPEALSEDSESVIAAIGAHLYRIRDGELHPYTFKAPRPNFDWFDNLNVARDGAIWVASYAGLFRVKDGEFQRWSSRDGLPGNRVHFVFEDTDGSIWAGLANGMARIKDGQLRSLTTANGLLDNRIYAIVPDDHGFFWIYSGRGIFRVTRQSLNEAADGKLVRLNCEAFDGLESIKFTDRVDQEYSGCRSADGRIWFPNPWGFVMIDPVNHVRNRVPPPVHIEQVRVDGHELGDLETPATLEVGQRRVEFRFCALSFIATARTRVQYQLEGIDHEWIEAGTRRTALYNNLPAGAYRFRVRAANADGVWNERGDEFRFTLPPPFYQRAWFYTLCAIVGTIVLFGSYRWKVRHMEVRQKQLQQANDLLEAKVARRTEELASSLSLLQATLNSTPDGIVAVDLAGGRPSYNSRFLEMWQIPPALADRGDSDALFHAMADQVTDAATLQARTAELRAHPEREHFDEITLKDGRVFERYSKPRRTGGKIVGVVLNFRDITERRLAEQQLAQFHQQLLESSRQVGMAEVATNVLHNVGNVLNSVNVSGSLAAEKVRTSKVNLVGKIGALLQEHSHDLPAFLMHDDKGSKIAEYLVKLGGQLTDEQRVLLEELQHLQKNIEHINEIVAMQQDYASLAGITERVGIREIVEHAIQMQRAALERQGIELVRDFRAEPTITVERHKVMQILVNLLRNAVQACEEAARPDAKVVVQLDEDGNRVRISITDNGVGIAPENLTRIFSHGFTTKKHGHGFGLHSAALAARDLGGALTGVSHGLGQGATFTLELPQRASEE